MQRQQPSREIKLNARGVQETALKRWQEGNEDNTSRALSLYTFPPPSWQKCLIFYRNKPLPLLDGEQVWWAGEHHLLGVQPRELFLHPCVGARQRGWLLLLWGSHRAVVETDLLLAAPTSAEGCWAPNCWTAWPNAAHLWQLPTSVT